MKWTIHRSMPLALPVAILLAALTAAAVAAPPAAPCDIYAQAGDPCVAAHSTTRALYAAYKGPLYQVKRESDGRTLDIGVVRPSNSHGGGYADAAAQDAFCANTLCVIERIYDQSGHGNDLLQAGPGTFKGPAKGGFDTQPIADMAPVTIDGHEAYGVYIMPGMGFRNNNASGIAVKDEPEGIYYVIDGTHYDNGCCFDYGNSSTNGRAEGTGTMETTYFGTSTAWGRGRGPGPWIMSDMEAGLFSGHGPKQNLADPSVNTWRFVTAMEGGGGGNRWSLRGGNAQRGPLATIYSGVRPAAQRSGGYWPMRKQGGILLGTGGDNGNGSAGTFYEGAITRGYPAAATTDAVQANIVAARYAVASVSLSRVTTFTPGATQQVTETFTNTAAAPVTGVRLSLAGPSRQWTRRPPAPIAGPVASGASVSATFPVTSPAAASAGFLKAAAEWRTPAGGRASGSARERVRSAPAVKINEVRLGTRSQPGNQFIELYNASAQAVNLSGWKLVSTRSQWAPVKLATIPAGTLLAAHGFYLLGASSSGLAAPARAGARTIYVRDSTGMAAGQKVEIGGETRTIARAGSAAAPMTTVFAPVSTGPWLTIPAGATNVPVVSTAGFILGQKIGINIGAIGGGTEIATVTKVGKAATQTTLAAAAAAGATSIEAVAGAGVSAGDRLTIGTGQRREIVKVAGIGTASGITGAAGTVIELAAPLRLDHAAGVDVSDVGTGISFTPATRLAHRSGDTVQALGSGVTLTRPLRRGHAYGAPVRDAGDAVAGYQGGPAPRQWFGGVLSPSAGSIALMDASGRVVVDAMVYGSQQSNSSGNGTIASPELATLEGDQGGGGCIVAVPRPAEGSGVSLGRFPDGADTDSNCKDFHRQPVTMLAAASAVGATNLKVAGVQGFQAGQMILVDSGGHMERATVAAVGSPGATTTTAATAAGATSVPVARPFGFRPGEIITIGQGAAQQTVTVAAGRRRGMRAISIQPALKSAHAAGTQVAGTGITLTAGLKWAHAAASPLAGNVPTPGAPNVYAK